ncbi:MAG TPA: MoxR family ATPase [Cytophagaceae bacterium]|jgi:MoxR-like ATPase|nr:MoxR family ATPase [Cytophagaceae bacterium]
MENQELFNNRTDLSDLRNAVEQLRREIAKIVVGQHQMVDLILSAILADGHVLIEGVPGVAKTLTAKIVARTISSAFSRIQFTPDMMPSDVLGTSIFNVKNSEFEFKKGPIFSNIVLIDEINRAPAKTQSALFEVMEERQITIDGKTYKMDAPFIVLATQNPVEQEGTYRLPEAQLDRFIYKIEIGYPSMEEEEKILTGFHQRHSSNDLSLISPVLSGEQIQHYREKVNNIHIDQNLLRYISQLVNQTRNNSALYLGASPRASIAIMRGAKAMAAMRGRDFVTPEDIKDVAYPVLGHRIMLTAEKEMEGVTAKDIIKDIITKIEVPR